MGERRTALVTGGTRGIGMEVCRQLVAAGYEVLLSSRDPKRGNIAAEVLGQQGVMVTPVVLDVSDTGSVEDASTLHPKVDVLVNNAGVFLDRCHPGLELDEAVLEATFEVNTLGAWRAIKAWAPGMQERGWGRVVNVSSGMGQLTDMKGGALAYRLSKTALNALTRVLAEELAAANIKVNSACPGWVKTDMGGANATRPVDKGAETITWLASLPDDGPTGGFFRDKKPIPW